MIDKIDKKRKLICFLSPTISVLLIVTFVILVRIFNLDILISGLVFIVIFITFLYLFSKCIAMPLYDNLVISIFNETFNNRIKIKANKSKNMNNDFYFLFNKDNYEITNHLSFNNVDMFDFRNINKKETQIFGKYIVLNINSNLEKASYIKFDKNLTNKLIDFYKINYNKIDSNLVSSKKNNKYEVLYNNKINYDLVNLFNDFDCFNSIVVKENKIEIILITPSDGFNFRLQDKLTDNIKIYMKEKYSKTLTLIDRLKEYLCI